MSDSSAGMRIAYILSSFPALSETFIVGELAQLLKYHIPVSVFSLKEPGFEQTDDPELSSELPSTTYCPFFFSVALWEEHFKFLFHHPGLYVELLYMTFKRLARQPVELFKTLAVFPKTIYFSSIAKRKNCQRIHAHFANVPTMTALIMSRILEIPFSCTAHGSDIYVYPPVDLKKRILAASPFITISNCNREYLTRTYSLPASAIRVVHCGIDLSKFPYRMRSGTSGKKIRILTVARLETVKGIDILLHASRALLDQAIDFEWYIIGEGSQREALSRLHHQLNVGPAVKFLGALSHAEVIGQYASADLFVLTSKSEGIPISVMEAMAMGLPVVTPRITGLPELVDHNQDGVMVTPEDPQAFAAAILALLSDTPRFEKLSKNSRRKIEERFNIQTSVTQLVKLWKEEPG